MSYNILSDSFMSSTISGIAGLSNVELSSTQLYGLADSSVNMTLASGSYVGIDAQFGMDMVCIEARVYSDYVASGVVQFQYKEFLENREISHGANNYNTDYSTPRMTSDYDPEPYSCSGTSRWDPVWYAAYKAFNQTCNDSLDCWQSASGPPQSIMFYFPYGKVINKYALQARNHATLASRYFPKQFYLQGNVVGTPSITNDSHWETLDYRAEISDPGQSTWSAYFTFENHKSYNYYRFKATQSNGTYVAISNIKLVEANRPESVPVYNWHSVDMSYGVNGYVYNIPPAVGIEEAKFFFGTSSGIVTLSGVELLVPTDVVSISGVVASGVYVDNHLLTQRTLDPFILKLQNLMPGNAQPYMLFRYTGIFDIDRNIFISPDYPRCYDKEEASWYGLDHGYSVPEIDSFEAGVFIGTRVLEREVVLDDEYTTGEWRSPVIDTNNKAVSAYVYSHGDVDVYVRASETPPPLVNFMVVTTDPTHRWLMYDHKKVYIDSDGTVIGESECNAPINGSKLWRAAGFDWAGTDLMYYGAINKRGTAAFLSPGYTDCGDTTPEQEFLLPDYWYNLNLCKLGDDSEWNVGTSVSGLQYGTNVSVVFTKVFPVDDSDGFFCFTATYNSEELMTSFNLSFHQEGYTRGSFPMFKLMGEVSPLSKIDMAYDEANSNWWVYIASELYKIDVGSINNVRIFSGIPEGEEPIPDTLTGYLWKTILARDLKGLVSIPSNQFSYFWGFDDTGVYLYEEVYQSGQPDIVERYAVTAGVQVAAEFSEFICGSCDSYGNLWALDLTQERVIRVNLQKLLSGDPRAVDYENQVAGVLGLWAHPTDGTCFLFISDEPEHPEQDIVRMVHAGQRWGSQGKYVCAIPGFYSQPYRGGTFFTANSFSGRIHPHESDPVWGTITYESDGALNTITESAVPVMTSNTTPIGYSISATSEYNLALYAFEDERLQRSWVSQYNDATRAIRIGFPSPVSINKYAIAAGAPTGNWPTSFELQIPADGYEDNPLVSNNSHWKTIDYRIGVTNPGAYQWTSYFTLVNSVKSKFYRLRQLVAAGPYIEWGQIKLVAAQEKQSWIKYDGKGALPRGRYKQIKIVFSRPDIYTASSRLQKVRLPEPIPLGPLSYRQETEIAIKSTLNKARTSGDWDAKLQVWWYNEEI